MQRIASILAPLLAVVLVASGATCTPWSRRPVYEEAPVVFEHTPTLDQVITTVNNNTAPIRHLSAEGVRISAPGLPSIRASVELAPPRKLRLKGDFLASPELDIGSNDEMFWIWSKHATEAVLYARHDEYSSGAAMHILPIEPTWLIDALGLVTFDPSAQHAGPYAHGPGEMEIHSQYVSPTGDALTKVTVMHAVYGWVTEQTIRDSRGRLLAQARASNHRYYPEIGVTLPDTVDVQIAPGQPTEIAFRVNIGGYTINQPPADVESQWAMPVMEGYQHVNLAEHPPAHSRLGPPSDRAAYRPEYRGYTKN